MTEVSGMSNIPGEQDYLQATYLVLVAALSMFFVHIMESNKVTWFASIPESGVVILVGTAFGGLGWLTEAVELTASSKFNNSLFELVFLPAIIFEAGYTLKKKGMFQNARPILLYAVFGTFLSCFATATAVFYLARLMGFDLHFLECVLFGALISATDTVATLSVFSRVFHLDQANDNQYAPLLYHLVFGESVLNDAVAICLFNTFDGFVSDPVFDGALVGVIILKFFSISLFSIGIGVAAGLFSALVTRWTRISENHKFDIIFMYMCAFGSYFLAAALELSGLLTIFFCGVVMGHYTWYNLSAFAQLSSPILFKSVSNLCEMLVFCFLGMSMFGSPEVRNAWSLWFTAMTLGVVIVVRFLSVLFLTPMANIGRTRKITFNEQVVISYASLRGALAFALSLKCITLGTPNAPLLVSCTMALAVFTIFVQGSTMLPLLTALGVAGDNTKEDEHSQLQGSYSELRREDLGHYGGLEDTSIQSERQKPHLTWWARLDHDYLQPIFVANPSITGGSTKQKFTDLGRILTALCYQPDALDKKHAMLLDLLNKFQENENSGYDSETGQTGHVMENERKRNVQYKSPWTPEKEIRTPSRIPETTYRDDDTAHSGSVHSTPEKGLSVDGSPQHGRGGADSDNEQSVSVIASSSAPNTPQKQYYTSSSHGGARPTDRLLSSSSVSYSSSYH